MTAATDPDLQALLDFWFDDATKPYWFAATEAFDHQLAELFGALYQRAAAGELSAWEGDAPGSLGLVLLLDQLPRNLFRDSARAYATDPEARRITKQAVARGDDQALTQEAERLFLYMPLEHSEDLADQERSVELIAALTGEPTWADYARAHRDVIARFGRFPHRNAVLGRESTAEERRFLEEHGTGW